VKSGNSGQIRVIEAFLAVTVVFSAVIISSRIMEANIHKDVVDNNLARLGLNVLFILDQDGSLCNYIESRNWTGICEALKLLLPANVVFNVTIYDEDMKQINAEQIANGGIDGRNIVSIEYVCTNRDPRCFRYYVIHLCLAGAGL